MESQNRWSRCVVAVCLSLLFSFSSLSVLVAQQSNVTSCCKAKCCCHKHHNDGLPEFSAGSCGTDCGHVTLGGVAATGDFGSTQTSAPAFSFAGTVSTGEDFVPSRFFSHHLQQRPPPSLSIV